MFGFLKKIFGGFAPTETKTEQPAAPYKVEATAPTGHVVETPAPVVEAAPVVEVTKPAVIKAAPKKPAVKKAAVPKKAPAKKKPGK
jgi:hypothetical protein